MKIDSVGIRLTLSRFIFISFVIAFSIGNFYKPSVLVPEIRIGLLDIVTAFSVVAISILQYHRLKKEIGSRSQLASPILVFLGLCTMSLLLSAFRYQPIQVVVGSLYLFRFAAYLFLIYLLPVVFDSGLVKFLKTILIFCLILVSGIQYTFFPDIRHLQISDWDPHYFRVVGSLLDPGFLSAIFCLVLFQLWQSPIFKSTRINRVLWILAYLIFALTYSRSGYLAFVAGWAYLAYTYRKAKLIVFPVILILLTILLLPRGPGGEGVKLERTSSIEARIINWKNSATIFLDHPLTGVGFNTYRYAQKQYGFLDQADWLRSHAGAGADSSLLFVAATTGIFGLISYIYLVTRIWIFAGNRTYLKAGFVALMVHSVFLNSLFYPFILFWIALSLTESKT